MRTRVERPVPIAIVGVGRMGAFHARTLAGSAEVDVVAVVDSRLDVVRRVGAAIDAEPLTDLDALGDRSDVEAWLIATPSPTHPSLVDRALTLGVHVLCEKPLSLVDGPGAELAARATASGLVLQVGFWRRFSAPWRMARSSIEGGEIGRPLMLRLSQWDADPPPPSFCDPAVSGGLAVDCGVHEFDLAEWLTGERVVEVEGRNLPVVDAAVGASGDVDNLVAVLSLSGGAVATVDLTRNGRYGDDVRTEVLGSDGAVFVDLLPSGRARLATGRGVHVIPGSEVADATADGVTGQAAAFAAAVRGERVDIPGAIASDRAVAIARAVQLSARTRARVDVA